MQAELVPLPAVENDPAEQLPVQLAATLPPRPYVPGLHSEQPPVVPVTLQLPGAHTVQPDAGAAPQPALPVQYVTVTLGVPE